MEAKRFINTWSLRTLTLVLGAFFHYSIYSYSTLSKHIIDNSGNVKLDGNWGKDARSLLPSTASFTASTDNYALYIQNANPNCNITIQIVDEVGQTVFEEAVSKDRSSYIVIPIDALQDGYYILEIRNATGGYIYGGFMKDADSF